MIKYEELNSYLADEGYIDATDIKGLMLDILNGIVTVEQISKEVKEYGEHND